MSLLWKTAVELGDIQHALDKSREHAEQDHADDLTYVPDWEPLHRSSIPKDEHDGWMFMERAHPKDHEPGGFYEGAPKGLVTYKHGITRTPLYLDQEGNAWYRNWKNTFHRGKWSGPVSAKGVLNHSGYPHPDSTQSHYDTLKQFGETPQTKYNEDYILRRNKRLQDAGYMVLTSEPSSQGEEPPQDWFGPKQALFVEGMAWQNFSGTAEEVKAKPTREAGFKGYVGHSDWEENEPENDDNNDGWDEDLWDRVRPEPTEDEQREYDEEGESGSHWYRHEQAYSNALANRHAESQPDITDDGLHEFIRYHGSDTALWQNKGRLGKVDLTKGVYATQSHVGQKHIDHYLAHPDSESWANRTHPQRSIMNIEYLGDDTPLFVTHEGRLHCIEGHHRVAAALQRGDKTIHAWHYDGDKHGLPGWDEDD